MISPQPIIATSRDHLRKIVLKAIKTEGPACDLNHIDVSSVEDMNKIFFKTAFSGDVSRWNTSKAKSMASMFMHSQFDADVSKWNVSNVEDMQEMFMDCPFNGDLASWDVARVTTTRAMFRNCPFTGDLTAWKLDRLAYCHHMFQDSPFQGGMPKIPKAPYIGEFPTTYRGSMNDYYSLERLMAFFKQKRWVDWYLEQTFDKRVDRVHIEKLSTLDSRPKWCSDKALFKWVKQQQGLCEHLGLDEMAVMDILVQQYRAKDVPSMASANDLDLGDVFSESEP